MLIIGAITDDMLREAATLRSGENAGGYGYGCGRVGVWVWVWVWVWAGNKLAHGAIKTIITGVHAGLTKTTLET